MNAIGHIAADGELAARVIRADGSHRDAVLSKESLDFKVLSKKLLQPLGLWTRLFYQLRSSKVLPLGMTLAAFVYWMKTGDPHVAQALVTTAGINLLAADFVSGAATHIAAFNFHDSGTGTTAAVIADTTLQTQAGPTTRATGTQSTPVAGQYKSVGTVAYTSTLAITEWGLFSQAAQGGTLWDHRIFSVINVANGDSIQFSYTLTCNAGGS